MTSGNRLEYWDTCIFIRYLEPPKNDKEEEQLTRIDPMMRSAAKGNTLIVVSTLVLAEIRPRESYNKRHRDIIDDLFYRGRQNVKVVAVHPAIAKMASDWGGLFQSTLTSPDAVHAATAFVERATVMYTLDGDADSERRRSGKLLTFDGKLGNNERKLRISLPPAPGSIPEQQLLDLETSPDKPE